MKIFEKVKRLIIGAAAVSMSAALLLPGVVAYASPDNNDGLGRIDMNKAASLSVYYTYDGESGAAKMAGVKVNAYKIASISETGQFSVVAPFDSLGLNITDMNSIADQTTWNSIITEAAKCVAANGVQPSYTATSDAEGFARLGTVDKGLYLGISDPVTVGEFQYKYWDFLSVVPGPNNLEENQGNGWDGTWSNAIYDVVAIPKKDAIKIEGDPDNYIVYKQWVDDGGDSRPKSINVKIFCDGVLINTVQLSTENNWQYTWQYEKGHSFTVEEELATDEYTATISRNENSFVIVNTKKPGKPDEPDKPKTPKKPEKPDKPSKPDKPDSPKSPDNPTTPEPNDDRPDVLGAIRDFVGELPEVLGARRLPQTGQLWWPIPILAILGIALIVFGFRSEKNRK